uniref:Uncharacterized protein n=1 Tax=Oryza rufipogon TaxID=4529 RepID=A0A0E0QCR3_ORYRU
MGAEAGSAREARAAEMEAGVRRSCRWMWRVFCTRRLADGRRRFRGLTCRQSLCGGGVSGAISSVSLCWSSGGRSRLAAVDPVLDFSWVCVLAMSVCGWCFFFLFPGYDPPGYNLVIFVLLYQ